MDYKILEDIPNYGHKDEKCKEPRYACASLGLFYVKQRRDLVPIAIQLHQKPSDDNLIWTPNDNLDWLYAKMWLRNSDAQFHQVTYLLDSQNFRRVRPFVVWLIPWLACEEAHLCFSQSSTSEPAGRLIFTWSSSAECKGEYNTLPGMLCRWNILSNLSVTWSIVTEGQCNLSDFFAKLPCYMYTSSIRKQTFNSMLLGFLFWKQIMLSDTLVY